MTVTVPANIIEQDGPLTFTVTVPDGSGIAGHVLTASDTFAIAQPPFRAISYGSSTINTVAGAVVNLPSNNLDPNLDLANNWQATGLPDGVTINSTMGVISGTVLTSDSFGTYPVTVMAADDGTTDSVAFTWNVIGPSITSLNPTPVQEGSGSFPLTITGSDFQFGGNATVTVMGAASATTWASSPTTLAITSLSDASMTVTVPAPTSFEQDGPVTITVTVPDGSGLAGHVLTSSDTLTINPPTALSISYGSSSFSYVAGAAVSLSSTNMDPNVQQWDAHSTLPAGLTVNSLTGKITGTITDSDSFGTYPITVTAIDDGFQDTITFSLTVVGPSVSSLNPLSVTEGSGSFLDDQWQRLPVRRQRHSDGAGRRLGDDVGFVTHYPGNHQPQRRQHDGHRPGQPH